MSGYFGLMTHLLTHFLHHPVISKAKITFISNDQMIQDYYVIKLSSCFYLPGQI